MNKGQWLFLPFPGVPYFTTLGYRMDALLTYLRQLFAPRKAGENRPSAQTLNGADRLLEGLANANRVPGLSATVLKDGRPVLQKGYGYAQLEAGRAVNPRTTLFRVASVSKPIAATALLRMVDEGLIALDESLYTYVPYFPRKGYDFSIRQLASHTAGIRGYRGKEFALDKPYSIREGIQIFGDDPLLFEPGTQYHYNSFDWALLSLAMEEACGRPFAEYVARKVLKPLGMHHTQPELKGEASRELANFYTRSGKGYRPAAPVNNAYKLAAGGYLSTSGDIARLGQAYLDGDIGDPALVAQFLSPQVIGGKHTYYGLGWEVSRDKSGRPFYGHTGNSVGAYSKFAVYPETGVVIAILVNCTHPRLDGAMDQLADFLHHEAW